MSSAALLWRREEEGAISLLKSAKKDEDRAASNTYLVIVISRSATHTTNYSGAIPLFCIDGVCDQICASLFCTPYSTHMRLCGRVERNAIVWPPVTISTSISELLLDESRHCAIL